jgi:predicted transcriptional regulator
LRRVKQIAAERDTSMSALMTQALEQVADEESGYKAACKQMLDAMHNVRSLGTYGQVPTVREELHDR